MSIAVCVICFNEQDNIERCLKSVKWADELVVVDSFSRDDTAKIARRYTDRVYERAWDGYVGQKNFAVSLAGAGWVLSLDADEEVSPQLAAEIQDVARRQDALDGYRMPRRSFYQGRWIGHSGFYPDRQLRFFRHGRGHFVGGRVHERLVIEGAIGELVHDLHHYPYHGSLVGQINTVNNFSTLMAQDLYERGKKYHGFLLLIRPFFKFWEVYLLRLGFMDGTAGFIIAVTSAYSLFARYVKLRELEMAGAREPTGPKPLELEP